jgi:hypothetical protein
LAVGNAIVTRAEGYAIYNFEVESGEGEDTHNYFVGKASGGAWVHNSRPCANGGLFDESQLGPMVAPQRHADLRERMGAAPFAGAHAHHDLPWEFREWFADRGINVNDPQFDRWVNGANHLAWSPAFQRVSERFIARKPNATKGEVLAFLARIRVGGKFR